MDNRQGLVLGVPNLAVLERETLNFTSKITAKELLFSENQEILLHIHKSLEIQLDPKNREEIILTKILPVMPDRPWDIRDYDILEDILQPYLRDLIENLQNRGYSYNVVYNLYLEVFLNLAKETKRYGSWWRATFMEGQDIGKSKINREIYTTFTLINERCRKIILDFPPTLRDKKRAVVSSFTPTMQKFTLLFLRLFEVSYLLNQGNVDKAVSKTNYLRDERYEADFYELPNY